VKNAAAAFWPDRGGSGRRPDLDKAAMAAEADRWVCSWSASSRENPRGRRRDAQQKKRTRRDAQTKKADAPADAQLKKITADAGCASPPAMRWGTADGRPQAACRDRVPHGVGGLAMAREACRVFIRWTTPAVMGCAKCARPFPAILRRVKQAVDFAVQTRPDAVVVIDSPDFTHRVARAIKKRDPSIRTVDYVAPQVWASRGLSRQGDGHYFDLVLAAVSLRSGFLREIWIEGSLCRPSGDRAGGQGDGAMRCATRLGIAVMRRCWRFCRAAAPARFRLSCRNSCAAVKS